MACMQGQLYRLPYTPKFAHIELREQDSKMGYVVFSLPVKTEFISLLLTLRTGPNRSCNTITNLQSTDSRSIEMVYWMWMYVWAAIQAIVTTVLHTIRLALFIGILFLLCMTHFKSVYLDCRRNMLCS